MSRLSRVMVVDDEENVRYVVATGLRMAGLAVEEVSSGRAALQGMAEGGRADLVVLDVGLPDLDGFEVCRRWRSDGVEVPVLFLTARGEQADRLRGLSLGGDDYMVKPFSIEELVLRVKAILRRVGGGPSAPAVLRAGSLELNDGARTVRSGGQEVNLSPTEYRLLRYLMENEGLALSKSQILDRVWSYDFAGESTVLETFISSLRKKVERDGDRLIHTVRGVGYRFQSGSRR